MAEILDKKVVKLRKACNCYGCGREFQKGHKLKKFTSIDNGTFLHTAWCAVCEIYWEIHMDYDDEIGYSELRSEDRVGWEEIRREWE